MKKYTGTCAILCPNCGEVMRCCNSEYNVKLWVCPIDGARRYTVNNKARMNKMRKETDILHRTASV
jgi:hypothetical protein